jgi:hypothetical protein
MMAGDSGKVKHARNASVVDGAAISWGVGQIAELP